MAATPQLLFLIHELEAVSSGSTIGPLAETLLEELSEGGSPPVRGSIRDLRANTKAAMREKAMARRKAMLTALNMPQKQPTAAHDIDAAPQAVSASEAASAASTGVVSEQGQERQDVLDEERGGLVCMVCKEGYASQPSELLGAYCYCMKLQPGEALGAVPELWRSPRASSSRQTIPQVLTQCTPCHDAFSIMGSTTPCCQECLACRTCIEAGWQISLQCP